MVRLAALGFAASATLARSSRVPLADELPPVVLVPGLTGSAMEARLTGASMPHFWCQTDSHGEWVKAWLNPVDLLPEEKDCLVARLVLTYNATDDSYANLPGVELRASGFGGQGNDVLYRYEFGELVAHLRTLGYVLGQNLYRAPYDWRLAGDAHERQSHGVGGFYEQLKGQLEEAVQRSGRPAVLLSHSLGCPTSLYFLHNFVSDDWKAAHLHSWVAFAGPWLGGATQASAYLGGWNLGLPSWLIPHDYVKPVQVNATSGVWISPHPLAFGNRTIVVTPSRNYTAADVPALVSIVGEGSWGSQTRALFDKKSLDLGLIQRPPSQVHMLNWYSTGVKTAERFEYANDLRKGFDDAPTTTIYGDGDGLVNLISLQQVEHVWPGGDKVETRAFPGVSHFGMLTDHTVLGALGDYLTGSRHPIYV